MLYNEWITVSEKKKEPTPLGLWALFQRPKEMGGENGKRRVERVKKDEKKVERMEEFTPKRQEEKPCKKEKGKKRSLCICYDVSMSKFNVQLRGLWDWKRRTGDFFRKAACFHRKKNLRHRRRALASGSAWRWWCAAPRWSQHQSRRAWRLQAACRHRTRSCSRIRRGTGWCRARPWLRFLH